MKRDNIIFGEGHTGGDCITHYRNCSFKKNPTLREFISMVLSQTDEWGEICLDSWLNILFEYRYGEVVKDNFSESDKDKIIELISIDGGYTRMDYTIKFKI